MSDPFAFMGTTRGSGRLDDPPPAPHRRELRIIVPHNPELAEACFELLESLNFPVAPLAAQGGVEVIACRFGFECECVQPGLWELRHVGSEPVGFLTDSSSGRPGLRARPRLQFELFARADGVGFA